MDNRCGKNELNSELSSFIKIKIIVETHCCEIKTIVVELNNLWQCMLVVLIINLSNNKKKYSSKREYILSRYTEETFVDLHNYHYTYLTLILPVCKCLT